MTQTPPDESILKLHAAPDGIVWYADGMQAPRSSGEGLSDFMSSDLWKRSPRAVRVLGLAANAALLTELYSWSLTGRISRLEVAGPVVCENSAEFKEPEVVLFRMRQCLLHPSLGGWHVFTQADYPSYAIAAMLQRNDDHVDSAVLHLLALHPAWPDLTFVRGIHPAASAKLLAELRDPRWYINPQRPERTARLRAFLGLTPAIQRRVSVATSSVTLPTERRCYLTMAAWRAPEPPSAAEREIPENFLWRVWHASGGGAAGDLRASQVFASYLRHTWLEAIHGDRYELFDPEMLFNTPSELQAYRDHRALRRQAV